MAFQITWTRAALFASGLRTGCFSLHTPPVAGLVADKSLLLVSSIESLRRSVCSTSISEACTVTGDQTDECSTSTDGVTSNEPQNLPLPSAVRTFLLSRGLDVRRDSLWYPQGLVGHSLGLLQGSLDVSRGFATVATQPAKKQKQSAKQRSTAKTSSQTPNPSNNRSESEEQLLAATAPSKTKSDGTIGVRFYKEVGVEKVESGYRVLLDGRALRSPAKRPLILSTKELALAIAAEWEWQDATNIRPFTMPLMKLASTATDLVPLQRPAIIENLMKYFRTSDAVCVREPRGGTLLQKQEETWDPILEWMQQEIGVRPVTSDSIFGAAQPEEVVQKVQVRDPLIQLWSRLA
jgi:chaperone required for assembly of F1-ATPase